MKTKKIIFFCLLICLFGLWIIQADRTNTLIIHQTQASRALAAINKTDLTDAKKISATHSMVFTLLLENPEPQYQAMRVDVYVDNPQDRAFFAALLDRVRQAESVSYPTPHFHSYLEWNTGEYTDEGVPLQSRLNFLFRDLSPALRNKPWKKKLEGDKIPFFYHRSDMYGSEILFLEYGDEDLVVRSIREYLMEALSGHGLDEFLT